MRTFRWSTTLLLLSSAAALFSIAVWLGVPPLIGSLLLVGAIALLVIASIFGKRGV